MARSFAIGSTTDKIDCGTSSTLQPLNGLTLAGWINPSSTSINYQSIFGRRDGTSNGDYALYFNGAATSKLSFFGAGASIDPGTNTISLNTWAHVAVTLSPTGPGGVLVATIYINGVQDSTVNTAITSLPSHSTNFQIGSDVAADNHFRGGIAADVALWNIALTASELLGLASGIRPFAVRQRSLVGYWPLDGLQSTEPDLSGNANNGTLTGTSSASGPPVSMFTPRGSQSTFPFDAPLVTFVTNTSKIQLPINCVVVSNQPEEKKSKFITDFTGVFKNIFRE